MSAKDKHAEDNQKRLAALTVWQKAREVQKKLVHNALANLLLDLQSHFGSDERFRMDSRFLESDSEEEQKATNCELPLMFQLISFNLYSFYIGIFYVMIQQSMTMQFMKENKKIKKKK
ncbi:Nucleolar protein 8, partial [Lemmus lemmus]